MRADRSHEFAPAAMPPEFFCVYCGALALPVGDGMHAADDRAEAPCRKPEVGRVYKAYYKGKPVLSVRVVELIENGKAVKAVNVKTGKPVELASFRLRPSA
jgi:hypothetical protein